MITLQAVKALHMRSRACSELRDHILTYSIVLSVRFVYHRAGRPAFQFKHDSSVQQALLRFIHHMVSGRLVTVQSVRQQLHSHVSDSTGSMSQPDEDATSTQRKPSDGHDTPFRQTECQYSDSTSSPASFGLMDVLHQILTLLELLDMDAQKALSATCRSLRERFVFRVQVVTVTSKEDCAVAATRRWPHLTMVILQDKEGYWCVASSPEQRRLADICLSADGGTDKATIILLRPLHMLTDSPCMSLRAQQLAHQMRTKWLGMNTFCVGQMGLSHVSTRQLDAFGIELVSQLIKGTWTSLQNLRLSGCKLKAHGFGLLSQGNWPSLKSLDISCNCLDAEGLALLAKGNWPRLKSINLGHNGTLSANGIACLSAANWPVETLIMDNMPFNAHMAAELVDLQLSLTSLYLDGTNLTAAAVTELARADWPGLTFFSLDYDDLDAVCVLLGLDLCKIPLHRQYDAYGIRKVYRRQVVSQPGVGLWPNLTQVVIFTKLMYLYV